MKTNEPKREQHAEETQLPEEVLEDVTGGIKNFIPGPGCGLPRKIQKPRKETGDGGATGSW